MIQSNLRTETNNSEYQYDLWRARFLKIMLWLFCGLGLILVLSAFGNANLLGRILFMVFYAALLAVSFLPVSYNIKASVLLSVGYGVGMYNLLRWGPWADGTIFFLAISVLASLLLDKKAYIYTLVITIASVLIFGMLNTLGVVPFLATGVPPTSFQDWLTYSADYFVLSISLSWGISLFRGEFRQIADRFNSTLQLIIRDRDELEQKVNERTQILTNRTNQLQAASYIARQTAEIQDLSVLLEQVVNLVTGQFGFYHTGIFLINESGDEAVLQAASSEGGRRMLERGHSLSVGKQGIVGFAAAEKKPRIALNVGTDAVFFNNPDLPMTRSELALPLIIRNKTLGVLDIQSNEPRTFGADDLDIFQTLADQIAVAIENARLLDESQAALTQLEALTSIRTREAWGQKLGTKNKVFTYTPLGLRAEKLPMNSKNQVTVPLVLRGQKIGNITIVRKGDEAISQIDADLIAEVANQTGLAIDNIRLLEEATQRAKQEQIVGNLARHFSQSLDIDTLLQTAVRELAQLPDVSEVSIIVGKQESETSVKPKTRRNSG